ncbi:hypothetical protein DS906_04900 [Ruegeria sp. A3M17]|nr:hypothetical protein DS906_04900 [Ruegeria sp. A3M17]
MRRSVGAPARLCQAGVGFYPSVLRAVVGIAGGLDGARGRRAGAVCATSGFAASAFAGAGCAATGLAGAG